MTSQLFESASLEEALAEVRDTVGPHARIVRAEKVRRGGIAGFFTKESFVLAVEHASEVTLTQAPAPAVVTAPSRPLPAVPPPAWRQPAQAGTWNDPYQDRFSAPMDTPAAYSLAALADFADRSDEVVDSQAPTVTETPVSTETPLFGQVLRDVSMATALDDQESAEPRWDGPLVNPREPLRSVMPLMSAPAAPMTPPLPPVVPYFQEQAPVVLQTPRPAPPIAPAQQPWWQTLAAVAEAQVARSPQASHEVRAAHAATSTVQAKATPVPPAPIWIDLSAPRPTLPPAAPAQTFDASRELAAGLATINAALGPALLPGSVIGVVGHPGDAQRIAARVAVAASADPFAIHIASPDVAALARSGLPTGRQVSTLDEAILRSRRWPSRPTPLVVVIDGRDSHWARTVLDAIEATTVLALPSPAHHDDQVRNWVAELGGVQALLVDDTCSSTAEGLALHGIPALRSPWSLESTRRVGDE